jgi:hypothetical protein
MREKLVGPSKVDLQRGPDHDRTFLFLSLPILRRSLETTQGIGCLWAMIMGRQNRSQTGLGQQHDTQQINNDKRGGR